MKNVIENIKCWLSNAFSLQMLASEETQIITVEEVSAADVATCDFESGVGHADTAAVLTDTLGKEVQMNRANISLGEKVVLFVAQLIGGRLPEGSTTLPEGFSFSYKKITTKVVKKPQNVLESGKYLLGNAFSLQMLSAGNHEVLVETVTAEEIANHDFESCVGFPDTAAVLADTLGKEVLVNRVNVALDKGDVLYVAQLVGGRLPEGSTTLPEGFSFAYKKVTVLR